MSDEPVTRSVEKRTPAGEVPLVGDDVFEVAVLVRHYRTSAAPDGRRPIETSTPPGIEIRRQPASTTGDPGVMSSRSARQLAALLVRVADEVDGVQPAPHEAAPPPLERTPRRIRPPHDLRDDRFDHLHHTDVDAWRIAMRLDRVAALLEPLAGLPVTDYEHKGVEWLAGFDVPTVAVFARLLHAARAAAPLPVSEHERDAAGP